MAEPVNKQLHFIIGIGRSGTTILNKILSTHTSIHSLPEANFLVFFLNQFQHKKNISASDIDLVLKQIQVYGLSDPWVGWDFDVEKTRQELEKLSLSKEGLCYFKLCEVVYTNFKPAGTDKSKAHILLDKNPSYTLFADKLTAALPDAKFVLLVRDYRGNVLSRKQNPFFKTIDVAYNAYRWRLFNKLALKFYHQNKDKVLLLRYEDFVTNNKNEMERIYSFFDLNFQDISEGAERLKKDTYQEHDVLSKYKNLFDKKYSDLEKPLNSDRLYSWKTELPINEMHVCDALCFDIGKQLGYAPVNELNSMTRFFIKIKCIVPITKAIWNIRKERWIYYIPVHYKLKRLIRKYTAMGLFKADSLKKGI